MKNRAGSGKQIIFFALILSIFFSQNLISQTVTGLDNWFNRETDAKTGKPYHYLWSDTAWSGYSRWGEIFVSKGATLKTVGKPTKSALKEIGIYIIVDPDTTTESKTPNYILPEDVKTITKWVRKGGVLAILANDAPNCEFTHLNELVKEFGIFFNHVTLHAVKNNKWETGASGNFSDHLLFEGVSKIYIKEVSDMTLSGPAIPVLTEDSKVLISESRFGKGYVFAIGDPWIYNEYIDHDRLPESFENRKAAENLTGILLKNAD